MTPRTFQGSDIECVLHIEAIVGESPVWSVREQVLYWVDIVGQKVHRYHPSTGANETFDLPQEVTCVALRERGGLVLTLRQNFAFYDPATGTLLKEGRTKEALGQYYASPVAADGKVYLASSEGKVTVLRAGGQWEMLGVADFGDEIHATPALADGRVYVRTRKALYCMEAR